MEQREREPKFKSALARKQENCQRPTRALMSPMPLWIVLILFPSNVALDRPRFPLLATGNDVSWTVQFEEERFAR
jgi:hypothetical protein